MRRENLDGKLISNPYYGSVNYPQKLCVVDRGRSSKWGLTTCQQLAVRK